MYRKGIFGENRAVWFQCTDTTNSQLCKWSHPSRLHHFLVHLRPGQHLVQGLQEPSIANCIPSFPWYNWRRVGCKTANTHVPHEGVSSLLSLHQGRRKTWNHQLNLLVFKFQRYLKQQVYSWISRLKESEVKHLFKCKQCSINRSHHPNKILPAKEKGSVCFPRFNCSKTAGWEILHCRKCACRLCTAFVMSKHLDLLKWKTVIHLVAGSSSRL